MRFRLGRPGDLGECHALLLADRALRMSSRVADNLPRLWSELLGRDAMASFAAFEDETSDTPDVLLGFGLSAFVRDDVARELMARPHSHPTARLYERELAGERVLLDGDQIRVANSSDGLHLLILHIVFRHHELHHPQTRSLLPVAGYSFFFQHAGYKLLSITGEVYGDEPRDQMLTSGYVVLCEGEEEVRKPYLLNLTREQVARSLDPTSLQLFHPEPPKFFFTRAEQRVLIHALLGRADRQIAEDLDVSTETLRSVWETVYSRVSRVSPRLLGEASSSSTRGTEKRRLVLEYLRQHMEELRPVQRPR